MSVKRNAIRAKISGQQEGAKFSLIVQNRRQTFRSHDGSSPFNLFALVGCSNHWFYSAGHDTS